MTRKSPLPATPSPTAPAEGRSFARGLMSIRHNIYGGCLVDSNLQTSIPKRDFGITEIDRKVQNAKIGCKKNTNTSPFHVIAKSTEAFIRPHTQLVQT
ncbi:hypothetical protein AVEN_13096-1 [Araneus ventricosus]|uniref:Uncharacterized protein n=1 Tax=Araneus ventricosus TaxID=182803 RepID=A0A4Y2UYN6_ARAVE|nr:hypothetical protein AVEN_13096-1 [Araneus ventricosus]